jgi:hypothetical protein
VFWSALIRALHQRTTLSARGPLPASGPTIDAFSLRTLKPHLKQDEKSADTRRRLLEAAIMCWIKGGYANTTGSEIAERAGLSRGAQLYHFPTQKDLFRQGGRASE